MKKVIKRFSRRERGVKEEKEREERERKDSQ
jgi:hypothetical protein